MAETLVIPPSAATIAIEQPANKSRRCWLAAFDWQIRPAAPFGPRAVVEALWGPANGVQRERQNRRRHTRAARCDDRLVEIDAGRGEGFFDAFTRSEAAIFQQAVERHVEGAGHVAGPQSGTRLGRVAGEPFG